MMTAWFVSGASLFALLIVDICCHPVKTGYYPDPSYGSSYTNTAPNYDSHHRVPSGQFPPGAVRPNNAPSNGVSTPSYQAVPQLGPSVPQPTVQRGPAPSVGSSGPVFSGNRGTAVRPNTASSAQPGGAFQPGPQDWAVAPPTLFSGGEEMSTSTRGVVPSQPEDVSPAGSMYQAGELSHYEKSFEHGNSERETEEKGWQPPPPPPLPVSVEEYARQGFTIQPQPNFNIGGWGPYPYYDFVFLTGQYPPGTITHTSSRYEQGRDHWQDVHYVRDYYPAPAQQIETFTDDFADPGSLEDPVAGSGQGDAEGEAQAGSGQGDAQAGSGQGDAQAGSGQGDAQAGSGQGGAQAGSGQGGAQAGSGQGGAQAGSGQGDAQAGSGQVDAQAGSGQGDAQAGSGQSGSGQGDAHYGQGGAHAGYGQGGAQAGYGQGGAQAGYGQGGAQAGYGQGGAHAGYGLGYGGFWQPVNRQASGYNLGKVAY